MYKIYVCPKISTAPRYFKYESLLKLTSCENLGLPKRHKMKAVFVFRVQARERLIVKNLFERSLLRQALPSDKGIDFSQPKYDIIEKVSLVLAVCLHSFGESQLEHVYSAFF